ncbi:hypothetical protein D3C72_2054010 [compost metagenome]
MVVSAAPTGPQRAAMAVTAVERSVIGGPGSLGVGAVLTVTVPAGGARGVGQVAGVAGDNGAVYISWT